MSFITNTDTTVLPYNTDNMKYDLDRQMYVLTNDGVKKLTGYDLDLLTGDINQSEIVRYEISQDIINHIASHSKNDSYNYKLWLIAKDENLRKVIERALADQTRYYVRSGAGVLKDMHGVHIEKAKALDINSIRGSVLISQSAEVQLLKSGLLFVGSMYYPDYKNDGTW